ncbi:MAG TPA: HlyD family efflux transporter periplasmic adaptor subunit [Spirochaetia bacterium]|nr:HlyD family efflux transporter periplasmic adaptor subunit [Spirochaetia bacterium]
MKRAFTGGSTSVLLLSALILVSCSANGKQFAYTGRLDVDPVTVSSQNSGLIESIPVREGDRIRKGEIIGQINTDRLVAQRKQQVAQIAELDVRRGAAQAQITQAEAQLNLATQTLSKTEKVLAQGGATRQQRDELSTQVQVDQANLVALQSNFKLVAAQEDELRAGMELTDIGIRDARIISPLNGVVLNKYHFAGELATAGTPLVELADLSVMAVEIYLPLSRLSSIKVGQSVSITVPGESKPRVGTIYWISSESEFTPKTILTQETRTTLVYGVKIRVGNSDDALKIGMPVDVRL